VDARHNGGHDEIVGIIMRRLIRNILLFVIATIVIIPGILAFNTFTHGSRQLQVAAAPRAPVDAQAASQRLGEAIRFRTISSHEKPDQHAEALQGMQAHIEKSFPAFHAAAKREVVAKYSLLYAWEGSDPKAQPIALLAHQDVVPVAPGTEKDWTQPPFDGVIADGFVWGRGSWDDKGNLYSMLEAAEAMANAGFRPRRTIYFAFGHDEETSGTAGAKSIAALLASRGVHLDFVIDEGLLITEGIMKGLDRPAALIGVAEKGYATLVLNAHATPGHSSMPPRDTAIGMMSAALARLEDHRLPMQIRSTVAEMFDTLAPEMAGFNRVAVESVAVQAAVAARIREERPDRGHGAHHHGADDLQCRRQGQRAARQCRGHRQLPSDPGRHAGERDRPCPHHDPQRPYFHQTLPGQYRSAAGDGVLKPLVPDAQPHDPRSFSGRDRRARPDGGRHRLAPLRRHYRQDFPLLASARQFGRPEAFPRHQRAPQHRGLCRHDPVLPPADRE
jgi:acetylornithine deacetylase/succinyl-diaminopimelate desuccinylase-like protein